MSNSISRRGFVRSAVAGAAMAYAGTALAQPARSDIRVVVWDEQQKEQKQAYENFLGNAIADHLRGCKGLAVRSVTFHDSDQGLSDDVVNNCDVMIWWSHYQTNSKIKPELTAKLLNRIKQGTMSLVTLHSAHWSDPFVEAMRYRTIEDALAGLDAEQRNTAVISTLRLSGLPCQSVRIRSRLRCARRRHRMESCTSRSRCHAASSRHPVRMGSRAM
jgi:hypothetical protein